MFRPAFGGMRMYRTAMHGLIKKRSQSSLQLPNGLKCNARVTSSSIRLVSRCYRGSFPLWTFAELQECHYSAWWTRRECLSIPASYCQGFRFARVCNECSLCKIGGEKKRTDSKLLQLRPHFCLAKVCGRSRWHHQSLVWRNFFSSLVTDNAFISPLKEDSLQ